MLKHTLALVGLFTMDGSPSSSPSHCMIRAFIAIVFAMFSLSAHAIPITWTLQGVTFDDGGTASGTFTHDSDGGIYYDINIVTTGGASISADRLYVDDTDVQPGTSLMAAQADRLGIVSTLLNESETAVISQRQLIFNFSEALTNSGGTVALTGYLEGETESVGPAGARTVISGVVTTVPIPGAAWLFGSALIGLVGFKRN